MTISARASITLKLGGKHTLILQQTAPTVFKWSGESSLVSFAPADYVCRHDAIKALRLAFESEPSLIGCDLTLKAAEQPPHIRAAEKIYYNVTNPAHEIGDLPAHLAEIADYVNAETNISDLLEHTSVLLAYLIRSGRRPKPPGLDMTEAGLILNVLEAIEKAEKSDLTNLKKTLTADVGKIQVYQSMPGGGKPQ